MVLWGGGGGGAGPLPRTGYSCEEYSHIPCIPLDICITVAYRCSNYLRLEQILLIETKLSVGFAWF